MPSDVITTRSTETPGLTITHRPPTTMPYPPPVQHANPSSSYPPPALGTMSYSLAMLPGQLTTPYSPPIPPAPGPLPYPLSMLPGQPGQMPTFQLRPVPAQATIPYPPQTQPGPSTTSERPSSLPTPTTTPSTDPKTAPQASSPHSLVWGVRIPCDGSSIHQMIFEIIKDQRTDHVPKIKDWWPERDPTANTMYPTLHVLDPPPLGGHYFLFTILDATSIPRNAHLGHRICGDAYLFKVNQLQFQAESTKSKFQHAIYEDVPGELLTSPLLGEILRPMEWKVLPPYNVVSLGFVRAQMREREMKEERERGQRLGRQNEPVDTVKEQEELVQRKREQMEKDTRAWEQKEQREWERLGREEEERKNEERKKEQEEMVRERERILRMVQTKGEQMEKDTKEWEQRQEREKQERERQEREIQERREYERAFADDIMRRYPPQAWIQSEHSERQERVAYEGASTAEVLVGLPYQLRPGMAITPDPPFEERHACAPIRAPAPNDMPVHSTEEQHASPSLNQPRLPNSPKPSSTKRHAVTPKLPPSRYTRYALRSSVKKKPASKKTKKKAPHNPLGSSFDEKHAATLPNQSAPHDTAGSSLEEPYGSTPITGPASHDTAGSSFEERHGFTPIQGPASHDTPGSTFEDWHRIPGIYDSPEQSSGEQNASTQSNPPDQ